jgi:hypothetical protein
MSTPVRFDSRLMSKSPDSRIKPFSFWQCLGFLLGLCLLITLIAVAVNAAPKSSYITNQSGAKSACHGAVSTMLTSPATAHFHDDTVTNGKHGHLLVNGEVDSENGFGALLTSAYTCKVTHDGTTVIGSPSIG